MAGYAAQANTVDLALSGQSASVQSITLPGFEYDQYWYNLHGLSSDQPVSIANGDTLNVTLTFDSTAWATSGFPIEFGIVPNDHFALEFGGLISGTTSTTGTFALYSNGQTVAGGAVSPSFFGINTVVDGAAFNLGSYSFNQVVSSFTVSGLSQTAVLQDASLVYTSLPPTPMQTSLPPIPSDPNLNLTPVSEPPPLTLMLGGLSLLMISRRHASAPANGKPAT